MSDPVLDNAAQGLDAPGRSLHWLLVLVGLTLASILVLRFVFAGLQEDLNQRSANERARLFVGEELVRGIQGMEKDMYRLAATTNAAGYARTRRGVEEHLAKLRHDVDVLERGGTVRRHVQLNVEGREDMVREVTYRPDPQPQGYVMEAVEIEPLLEQVLLQAEELKSLLAQQWDSAAKEDRQRFYDDASRIQDFLKHIPPYFERLEENANRLFFDSGQRLQELEAQFEEQGRRLRLAEMSSVALLILLAGLAATIFFVRINHARAQLESALVAMRDARDAAEAASRAKSEFVSRMSHELRTPLNAIIGFGELLAAEPLQPSHLNYVRNINGSGRHLLELINRVLDLAKIEAGGLKLESIAFELPAELAAVQSIVAERAAAKGIDFVARIAANLPRFVEGDPTRLRQVLINLLVNAVKFTERGSVELEVEVKGRRLHFQVRDSGIGMDAQTVSSLFRPFVQADASVTRRFGGTGLGLAISRELVEAMGGSIDVVSTPGVGTRFRFSLPLRQLAAAPAPVPATQESAAHGAASLATLVRGRVLLVDDNQINRQLASAMLTRLGLACDTADDGRECLARVGAQPFAVVLMDMEMPGMDGLTATRHLRERERSTGSARLPIIAMTANALKEDRDRCLAAGMDGYVAKPIGLASLAAELRRLFENSEAANREPPPSPHAATQRIWDRAAALEMMDGDEALLAQVAALFAKDAPLRLKELEAALQAADWGAVARVAHTLKGLFGTFVAQPAREAALALEKAAKAESPAVADMQIHSRAVQDHVGTLVNALMRETASAAPQAAESQPS